MRPWVLPVGYLVQETPYEFKVADSTADPIGCRRCPVVPDQSLAGQASPAVSVTPHTVNSSAVLGPRLAKCRTERGQIPNFVAVDNWRDRRSVHRGRQTQRRRRIRPEELISWVRRNDSVRAVAGAMQRAGPGCPAGRGAFGGPGRSVAGLRVVVTGASRDRAGRRHQPAGRGAE